MNKKLSAELRKAIMREFGFQEGDPKLAVVEPVANSFGSGVDPAKTVEALFKKLPEAAGDGGCPPEIVGQGLAAVCNYLKELGYDRLRRTLLAAAAKI